MLPSKEAASARFCSNLDSDWAGAHMAANIQGDQMNANPGRDVTTVDELLAAVQDGQAQIITVSGDLTDVPSLRLAPGQTLRGSEKGPAIRFRVRQDGVQLSSDNKLIGLVLACDVDRCAVFNDTSMAHLGSIQLKALKVTGVVRVLAKDSVRGGHIEAHQIHIAAADARACDPRPQGYGVEVIPGAFTVWNQQTDKTVVITADITGLSVGDAGKPVLGSGVFVSGGGFDGGRLVAPRIETGAIYSEGGIAPGTADRISGGVFVVYGAFVDSVRNNGPITTYGANDMVLDNWGTVDRWTAADKITSHGPSGIGFVNFGTINQLEINAPIETFGQGARGFNVYTGTVGSAVFDRIVTHADGAVGLQISQPVGEIKVRGGIETYGGKGESLVKGVVVKLSAIALSVKPGGSIERAQIAGGLITHGSGVAVLELHGKIGDLEIAGGTEPAGGGFDKI
jgi:hypothetical protein